MVGVEYIHIDLTETRQTAGESFLSENEGGHRNVVIEGDIGARTQAGLSLRPLLTRGRSSNRKFCLKFWSGLNSRIRTFAATASWSRA